MGVAQVAFDFDSRRKRRNRIDYDYVKRSAAYEDFDDFQRIVEELGGLEVSVDCAIRDWRLIDPELDPSLEEASLGLGASRFTTLRRVTLPLVLPAVKAGMRYLFTVSLTAISAVIFLVSVNWSLLTVRILQCITELMFAEAAAFSVVLVAIVFAAIGCIDLIFRLICPRSS